MKGKLRICYHGTNRSNSTLIKKQGFKPWTYFAKNLEDALFYGGEYIFEVVFEEDKLGDEFVNDEGSFQFRIQEWLGSEKIVAHYRLRIKKYFDNEKLREKISKTN